MTSSEKPPQPAATEQQPGQPSKTRVFRNLSPAELREHGVPIRNELIISPVPRRQALSER
jgi:hypothetical protein